MPRKKEQQWDEFIESRILTGMIVSTDFLSRVHGIWDDRYVQSPEVGTAAHWIFEYFERYAQAPDSDVQDIYVSKMRAGAVDAERGELIEIMLQRASEDYGRDRHFNSDYLFDQARDYFRQQHLTLHAAEVQELVEAGETEQAARLNASFVDVVEPLEEGLFLDSDEAEHAVHRAFSERYQGVVKYPPPFGDMVNRHMARDGFVALLSSEKTGKSWLLMDIALRALRQKSNVAFFQAGDMSQHQQLKRICTCLARTPVESLYPQSGKALKPVKDCIYNQTDQCDRDERECDFGPFDDREPEELRKLTGGLQASEIRAAMERDKDYRPCRNCRLYRQGRPWGSVWFRQVDLPQPLDEKKAWDTLKHYTRRYRSRFMLSTHANGTLSPAGIRSRLNDWERRYGFLPDTCVIDYADLLEADGDQREFRHRQNAVWASLRGLAQERHCLVLTATQADARSYSAGTRLSMANFSEDKRKNAHVTAMFGLNQGGADDREKQLGLMYVNEIVVREGEFMPGNGVYIMQCLGMGRPFLGSFR